MSCDASTVAVADRAGLDPSQCPPTTARAAWIFHPNGEIHIPFLSNNVGILDRALRIGAGILLIALAFRGTIGYWGYFGVIPLLTGVVGSCPAYTLFGLSTCTRDGR